MSAIVLSKEDAKTIKRLEDAACEHGVVMDLLSAIEVWQSNGEIAAEDKRFFEVAAIAAGLSRIERENRKIDKD